MDSALNYKDIPINQLDKEHKKQKIKDPGSSITHMIGAVFALVSAFPLIYKAANGANSNHLLSFIIFITSMFLLYSASTTYHTFDVNDKVNKILKKLDHGMIFVLIAGTYTPICVMVITGKIGLAILITVWSIAILGILFKIFWVTCPKWISSVMYIAMGWVCIFAFPTILKNMSTAAFLWLLIGGIIYTVGGVIYALKLSIFNSKHKYFGSHEIFHLFVLGGSICHFVLIYSFLA